MVQLLGYYSSMGEKITIDTDDLRKLIREEMKSAPAETKATEEEVEEEVEEVEEAVEEEVEEAVEESEKTLSEMSPKEVEAFFANVVKKAMGELDAKKTSNAKKIKPKAPRTREEEEDENPKPVKSRHDETREGSPTPPPKKKRFSMWGDDEE